MKIVEESWNMGGKTERETFDLCDESGQLLPKTEEVGSSFQVNGDALVLRLEGVSDGVALIEVGGVRLEVQANMTAGCLSFVTIRSLQDLS